MQIELEKNSDELWTLIYSDHISDKMGFDEMLGLLIAIAAQEEPRCLELLKPIKRISEPRELSGNYDGDDLPF